LFTTGGGKKISYERPLITQELGGRNKSFPNPGEPFQKGARNLPPKV